MRILLWFVVLLPGCAGPQSALDPAGPAAESIHRLGLVMSAIGVCVTLLVIALLTRPFVGRSERRVDRRLFLWGGGVALPFVILVVLVPYIMTVGRGMRVPESPVALTIDVTGHQFWWEMSYRRHGDSVAYVSANELRLPVGETVELQLRSTDVIHSLWVPRLAGKTDLIPGRVNRMVIRGDTTGVYRGQCAEFCGRQHALMAFDVVVMPRAEFDAWLARLGQPVAEPSTPELREGRDHFVQLGCGGCHTVRGVSVGPTAPDLTVVGGRRMIGAGALPGGLGNIAAWIASAQHLKPGNAMPSFDRLEGPQLRALAAWLASLR